MNKNNIPMRLFVILFAMHIAVTYMMYSIGSYVVGTLMVVVILVLLFIDWTWVE